MQVIRNKYLIKDLKERSGKQRNLKFEEFDFEIYRLQQNVLHWSLQNQMHHWINTLHQRYFDGLKDNKKFHVKWIDHEGNESFHEIEIKISTTAARLPTTCEDQDLTT